MILCLAMEGLVVEATVWPRRELRSSSFEAFWMTEAERKSTVNYLLKHKFTDIMLSATELLPEI